MSETRDIAKPGVNMNGTSRAELFAQYMAGVAACEVLLQTMRAAMPHGRDYQISEPFVYERARREMLDRLLTVKEIRDDFEALAMHVRK